MASAAAFVRSFVRTRLCPDSEGLRARALSNAVGDVRCTSPIPLKADAGTIMVSAITSSDVPEARTTDADSGHCRTGLPRHDCRAWPGRLLSDVEESGRKFSREKMRSIVDGS